MLSLLCSLDAGVFAAEGRAFVGLNGNKTNLVLDPPAGGQVVVDGVAFRALTEQLESLSASLISLEQQLNATRQLLAQSWRVLIQDDASNPFRFCSEPWSLVQGRGCHNPDPHGTCASKFYSSGNIPYTAVRGSLGVFQQGGALGLAGGGAYDMISFYAGAQHVWTYAIGLQHVKGCTIGWVNRCPDRGGLNSLANIIGSNFTCATANIGGGCFANDASVRAFDVFFQDNELFAGQPFEVVIPAPTTAPVEVRVCTSRAFLRNADFFFQKLSLQVF